MMRCHHAESRARRFFGRKVDGHKSAKEAYEHADAEAEHDHGHRVDPKFTSGIEQEQRQGSDIEQAENKGRDVAVALEYLSDITPDSTVPAIPHTLLMEMMNPASTVS